MAIDLDDLMEFDTEDENQSPSNNTQEDINYIEKQLEESKNRNIDLTESISNEMLIDKNEFRKFQKAIEKKEMNTEISPQIREKVDKIKSSMDLRKSTNIVAFGSKSQERISNYSKSVLNKTKGKDSGEVGKLLTDLMLQVKDTKKPEQKNIVQKLIYKAQRKTDLVKADQQSVQNQIATIENKLKESRQHLMNDINLMDELYQENLQYYEDLNAFIIAGKEIIKENNEQIIPNMLKEVDNIENEGEKSKAVQQIKDYQSNVNRFEKRVHDLEVSKVISIQMMPQLKLIQDNDMQLADKIQDAIVNVVPLWQNQFVIAMGLKGQKDAVDLSKMVSKTSNDLIKMNADMLHDNTLNVKREAERSIVDMETLEYAQNKLISTIEESLQIEAEAKKEREKSQERMAKMENELRIALLNSINKSDEAINTNTQKSISSRNNNFIDDVISGSDI